VLVFYDFCIPCPGQYIIAVSSNTGSLSYSVRASPDVFLSKRASLSLSSSHRSKKIISTISSDCGSYSDVSPPVWTRPLPVRFTSLSAVCPSDRRVLLCMRQFRIPSIPSFDRLLPLPGWNRKTTLSSLPGLARVFFLEAGSHLPSASLNFLPEPRSYSG